MRTKGQVSLANAPALIITLVVLGIILGLGATVIQSIQENIAGPGKQFENSTAWNATQQANEGIITFAGFQPVIAIVLVAALILGLVALIAFAGGGGPGMA